MITYGQVERLASALGVRTGEVATAIYQGRLDTLVDHHFERWTQRTRRASATPGRNVSALA
jgi:hypothetical protein